MKWDYFFNLNVDAVGGPIRMGYSVLPLFIHFSLLIHITHRRNLFIIFYIEVQTMRFACQNMIFHFFLLFFRSFGWNEQMLYIYKFVLDILRQNTMMMTTAAAATVAALFLCTSFLWMNEWMVGHFFPNSPILWNIHFNHFSKMKNKLKNHFQLDRVWSVFLVQTNFSGEK